MSDFLKKALGLFVEFDDAKPDNNKVEKPVNKDVDSPYVPIPRSTLNSQEIERFTKHFDELFSKAKLPGPDYYEFSKMMTLLEKTIPDENIRIATVFASLSLQGLTKDRILRSASQYIDIVKDDRSSFEKAANEKSATEVVGRKDSIAALAKQIDAKNAMIQKLTQEVADAQNQIGSLQAELVQQDNKLAIAKNGYNIACQGLMDKIQTDIQKINTTLG